jgi:hypothetical protein
MQGWFKHYFSLKEKKPLFLTTRTNLIHFTVTVTLLKLNASFQPSLAHRQEALHEHSFGGCSVLL